MTTKSARAKAVRSLATATREVGDKEGNGDGSKSNSAGNKEGNMAGDKESAGNGDFNCNSNGGNGR